MRYCSAPLGMLCACGKPFRLPKQPEPLEYCCAWQVNNTLSRLAAAAMLGSGASRGEAALGAGDLPAAGRLLQDFGDRVTRYAALGLSLGLVLGIITLLLAVSAVTVTAFVVAFIAIQG
jgi:hypothetical protein